jgi:hypothetical protein
MSLGFKGFSVLGFRVLGFRGVLSLGGFLKRVTDASY